MENYHYEQIAGFFLALFILCLVLGFVICLAVKSQKDSEKVFDSKYPQARFMSSQERKEWKERREMNDLNLDEIELKISDN